MIFLLTALIIVVFILVLLFNKKNILEPSTIFAFSFVPLLVMASINYYNYDLNIGTNTFFVILLGVIEFVLICQITKHFIRKTKPHNEKKEIKNESKSLEKVIEISNLSKVFLLLFVIVSSLIYLYFVVKAVGGSFNSLGEISAAISKFDSLLKFSNNAPHMPFIVSNLSFLITGAGYWFIYVVINNLIIEKKIRILDAAIIITILLSTFLSGSRTTSFFMIIAAIVFYLYLSSQHKKFNKKHIKILAIIICSFILLFAPLAKLLGRDVRTNYFEYISVYCGAEVKNLDIFLNDEKFEKKNNIWGSQTFYHGIAAVGRKIGSDWYKPYQLDLPFQSINGKSLGNVYTTFYPYIYDFGYIGEAILVAIMAFVSQLIFEKMNMNKKGRVNKWLLLYAIVYTCLLLSFFSNKFYESLINTAIIKYIIAWFICDWVFIKTCRIKFRKKTLDEKVGS